MWSCACLFLNKYIFLFLTWFPFLLLLFRIILTHSTIPLQNDPYQKLVSLPMLPTSIVMSCSVQMYNNTHRHTQRSDFLSVYHVVADRLQWDPRHPHLLTVLSLYNSLSLRRHEIYDFFLTSWVQHRWLGVYKLYACNYVTWNYNVFLDERLSLPFWF